MSEEGKKEFFEWKDEIESKYNDLSESRIRCENKIEALEKKQKHDFNKLLWIKMIPYKEWFWGLKMFVEEQIAVIIKKLTWLSNENAKLYTQIDDDALKRAKLEEVLRDDYRFKIENLPDNELKKHYEGLLEKLDSNPKRDKSETPYLDLGTITTKNGELHDYNPSQFVRDYAKKHAIFSLFGLMFPEEASGGEKEEEISVVADEDSPRLFPKDTDHLDSKLSEIIDCFECKYYSLSDRSMLCVECVKNEYSKFKPKEKPKTEPEKELYELYLKEKGECYFRKITHPFTEYNNMVHRGIGQKLVEMNYDIEERVRDATRKEQIEGFLEKLEFLRDKVLEAPIISGSVQDLRDHIHDIKDLVIKTIKEYEEG